jgi:hypothetical protein
MCLNRSGLHGALHVGVDRFMQVNFSHNSCRLLQIVALFLIFGVLSTGIFYLQSRLVRSTELVKYELLDQRVNKTFC